MLADANTVRGLVDQVRIREHVESLMSDVEAGGRTEGDMRFDDAERDERLGSDRAANETPHDRRRTAVSDRRAPRPSNEDGRPFGSVVPLAGAIPHRPAGRYVAALRGHSQAGGCAPMLLGNSLKMLAVRDLIDRVASTDVIVLIRGESGTGKELVARALHAASYRRDKPFVKVNCAALPADLLESELFGFERGAFTGALNAKPGKFEFAHEGTIFLDEIGEMSPPLQAKLLQVLQDGEFSRLGGKSDVRVNVRIVAATNRDLERAVVEAQFREDLFFRLNVVCITLPPLRERREEIPALARHFLTKYSAQYNRPKADIPSDLMRRFMEHAWPGNVRELENVIQRVVVLGSQGPIHDLLKPPSPNQPKSSDASPEPPAAPPAPAEPSAPAPASLKDVARAATRAAERELILRTLDRTHWNRKEAAAILHISYKALLYKIKENGFDQTQ